MDTTHVCKNSPAASPWLLRDLSNIFRQSSSCAVWTSKLASQCVENATKQVAANVWNIKNFGIMSDAHAFQHQMRNAKWTSLNSFAQTATKRRCQTHVQMTCELPCMGCIACLNLLSQWHCCPNGCNIQKILHAHVQSKFWPLPWLHAPCGLCFVCWCSLVWHRSMSHSKVPVLAVCIAQVQLPVRSHLQHHKLPLQAVVAIGAVQGIMWLTRCVAVIASSLRVVSLAMVWPFEHGAPNKAISFKSIRKIAGNNHLTWIDKSMNPRCCENLWFSIAASCKWAYNFCPNKCITLLVLIEPEFHRFADRRKIVPIT